MKVELSELTKLVKPTAEKTGGITPISADKSFLEGLSQNVKQVMAVLDNVGVKDVFVEKAKQEINSRFFGKPRESEGGSSKPTMNVDKIISLAMVWLDSFIEQNGDMPLSQFKKEIESQKEHLITIIKSFNL